MNNKDENKLLPLQTTTNYKQSTVYKQIKKDILNNTYPPGTIMVERKLCEIYNVSRSPLRNALQQLSYEGLLSFAPGQGVMVPEFNIEDILEVYDLIELLQGFAIKSCISKLNDIALETLEEILSKMKLSRDQGEIGEAIEWDQKFHEFIFSFAGNKRLKNIFSNLNFQSMRFQATTIGDDILAERSYDEHYEIYNSMKNKDSEGAVRAVSAHYHNIKQYYINMLLKR